MNQVGHTSNSELKVLIVEDETILLDLLCESLAAKLGITHVQVAMDGEKGIEAAKAFCPDLVIMDIELPGMNGIQATREILAIRPQSKIIALSAPAPSPRGRASRGPHVM